MNEKDIEVIVNMLTKKDTPFLLVTIVDNNGTLEDYYYCAGSNKVSIDKVLSATIGNATRHLLDEGNAADDIKEYFNEVMNAAEHQYNEDHKMVS